MGYQSRPRGKRKHNLLRFGRKRRYKPAKKNSGSESAEELRHHEARSIDWTNPGNDRQEKEERGA